MWSSSMLIEMSTSRHISTRPRHIMSFTVVCLRLCSYLLTKSNYLRVNHKYIFTSDRPQVPATYTSEDTFEVGVIICTGVSFTM